MCAPARTEGSEVLEGSLRCTSCGATFAISRGVPRLAPDGLTPPERATAHAFGEQWKLLSRLLPSYQAEFESYLTPTDSAELRGLVVLDAGCGMGKFSLAAALAGARTVIGVDLSDAVDVAYERLRHVPNAHVVQGDLNRLPFRPQTFDFVFSIGVLHHTPDPERAFRSVVDLAAKGGRVFVWLYAREGNEAFIRWVDPWRSVLFSRLPSWVNRGVTTLLAVPLWAMIKTVYVPFGRSAARRLPYADYFLYFSRMGFRTFWGTVYDKLVPPIAFYLTRPEIERWFAASKLTVLSFRHRNGNSWSCLGSKDASA
jgi:SAM-dependent methyltransferase